jgi:hypothetical protein
VFVTASPFGAIGVTFASHIGHFVTPTASGRHGVTLWTSARRGTVGAPVSARSGSGVGARLRQFVTPSPRATIDVTLSSHIDHFVTSTASRRIDVTLGTAERPAGRAG